METAINMQGDVQVQDDGTWAYTWGWTYGGTDYLSEVKEEFMLTDNNGTIIDYKDEAPHDTQPGQTYIGGGSGNRQIPPGNVNWSLRVIQGDGYLGITGGSFFAATAPAQ